MRIRWLAPAGLALAALVAAACGTSAPSGTGAGSSGTGPSGTMPGTGASAGGMLKTTTISGARVLTSSHGFTLYWFAPDSPAMSKCNGSCASLWPPVKGPVTATSGVKGTFGVVKRADGTMQATYNGHPLYTYKADTAPGQASGNGLNASGGVWHEMATAGGATQAPAQPSSPGSGGGGY